MFLPRSTKYHLKRLMQLLLLSLSVRKTSATWLSRRSQKLAVASRHAQAVVDKDEQHFFHKFYPGGAQYGRDNGDVRRVAYDVKQIGRFMTRGNLVKKSLDQLLERMEEYTKTQIFDADNIDEMNKRRQKVKKRWEKIPTKLDKMNAQLQKVVRSAPCYSVEDFIDAEYFWYSFKIDYYLLKTLNSKIMMLCFGIRERQNADKDVRNHFQKLWAILFMKWRLIVNDDTTALTAQSDPNYPCILSKDVVRNLMCKYPTPIDILKEDFQPLANQTFIEEALQHKPDKVKELEERYGNHLRNYVARFYLSQQKVEDLSDLETSFELNGWVNEKCPDSAPYNLTEKSQSVALSSPMASIPELPDLESDPESSLSDPDPPVTRTPTPDTTDDDCKMSLCFDAGPEIHIPQEKTSADAAAQIQSLFLMFHAFKDKQNEVHCSLKLEISQVTKALEDKDRIIADLQERVQKLEKRPCYEFKMSDNGSSGTLSDGGC